MHLGRRWCTDHSDVPVLLIPPALADPAAPAMAPSNSIIVAGAGNLEGLHAAFDFAVRPGGVAPAQALFLTEPDCLRCMEEVGFAEGC